MNLVKLNIPILVQNIKINEKKHFFLRPLFFIYPRATDLRFEKAVVTFKKEVRHRLNGFELERSNADELFWFLFNPKVDYYINEFDLSVNKQLIRGKFAYAKFELKGHLFVCLPAFSNFMFLAKRNKKQKNNVKEQVQEKIEKLFKIYKNNLGIDFDPERYTATKGEFITNIRLSVNIKQSKFHFEKQELSSFFSTMSGDNTEFEGSVEITKVGYDLNAKFPSELKRAYYRDELVQRLSDIIYQKENTPIVLIGPKGVGKQTLVHEIVFNYLSQFEHESEEKTESRQKIWFIDPTRIITGMSIIGWWQKRMEAILNYVMKRNKSKSKSSDCILIDNIVAMLRIGQSGSNSMNANDVIKPYLEKRSLQLLVLASPEEWKIVQEKDRRFSDLFQVFRMHEPSVDLAARMVLQQRKSLEEQYECEFNIQAIHQLFTIQRNYLKRKALPGSIMKLMKQLAVKFKFQGIDVAQVRDEFKDFSGLNESIFDEAVLFEKKEVHKKIASQLVGQNAAVDTLTNTIHVLKAKLNDPKKPIGSFLFIGPTGVGKTQAAKVLCNYLMGHEDHLIRFDMNEYIDEGAIYRLIGDRHNPEGQLTGKVRYRPFSILLLDEIEKAHPKIHDLLLQVLDDGRLTDSIGRTVDFSNTIIIMTSNVGAKDVGKMLGFEKKNQNENAVYRKAVEKKFRPEFINRIDQIVIFNPLKLDHILNIAHLQIKELLQRDGFVRRTTILNISKDALEWVARRGYDEKMGGRALKRQIEKDLTFLSAEQLIATHSDQAIILEIGLKDQKLLPLITRLHFVEKNENGWLPDIPDESKGRSFFNSLLRKLENIEQKIRKLESDHIEHLADDEMIVVGGKGDNLNWQYFDFKEKLADAKQQITDLSLGFRNNYFTDKPALPLRLKGGMAKSDSWSGTHLKQNLKDRLFQKDALAEINEVYTYSAFQFNSASTEFMDSYLTVAFIKLFARGFLEEKTDKLVIQFKSIINGQGKKQMKYLMKLYQNLLVSLDIEHKIQRNKNEIIAEGHSLSGLLEGECGIHLFYLAHQNPLPIRLNILKIENREQINTNSNVIRLYDEKRTLTDLRTGFTNAIDITPKEFKLLLFAGVSKKYRRYL